MLSAAQAASCFASGYELLTVVLCCSPAGRHAEIKRKAALRGGQDIARGNDPQTR